MDSLPPELRARVRSHLSLRDGVRVVLAGAPNSGKSSLFNALVGRERALVDAEPGTTRDVVSASVRYGGLTFVLQDTAGLRPGGGRVEGYVPRDRLAAALAAASPPPPFSGASP